MKKITIAGSVCIPFEITIDAADTDEALDAVSQMSYLELQTNGAAIDYGKADTQPSAAHDVTDTF